ncbi:TcpQ domain-containing protein [Aliiglaciecola litoralis]|uniref:Toxin co-regulated pilus biosynthesis protein Q C-terminal domain-containing protein n=1 Tax=Aliiglaciecola litoralis TaxID=582857 RepID=A0ABN1LJM3_9ALTE
MVKRSSSVIFWAKHIGLALALIIIAVIILNLQQFNLSKPKPQGQGEQKSVSQGMTDFYTAYRMSSSQPYEDDIGDFVMEVNPAKTPLDNRLKDMESIQSNIPARWVGEHKFRSFRPGSTVREAITDIAQSEGMQLIWELDKDFIIKNQFQMDNTVAGSLAKIASAIDSSFEDTVQAYICPKQRSLVIMEGSSPYVREHCTRLP